MEYHSTGSPTARLGGSVPNPTDLTRRLLSTQQAQDAAESTSEGGVTPTSRSRINSVTRFDISPGTPFWGSFSPAPRSPVLIQCCCRREDCQNLLAFLESTRSMEDELRLAAEVGQALLQKHELYQKEMETFRSALEHQCARAEQKVQESDELVRELDDTQRILIRERDDALRQKNLLEEKNDTLVTALDKADSMLRDLDTELKARDNEIKKLTANNIKGERSEEREEILRRQLEDLQQELNISRKSEMAAEMKVKKLSDKFDQLYGAHENLKKEQIETQKSKQKLEAVAMLRESNERIFRLSSSNNENNEANHHLIALIKELSSANNKLKSEISEYRELLSESRNELSTLQNRIEDIETASTTGYAYPASHASSVAFASPFKPNFPPHVLDEMGMGGMVGENLSNTNIEVEECGEGSTTPSGSAAKPILPHMSPISSSFGPASYNTFNSLGVDPSVHSPAGSFVSTSALSSSNPLHHHHHYHHYHHYPNENVDIVRGGSVFGELEKYLMKKTKHKRPGRNSIKGKKVFVEIGEEDEEQRDTIEKKREIIGNGNSDSDITYSDDSDEERDPEGADKLKKKKSKSKLIKGQGKKKARAFSLPDQNISNQKQNVSLLSASLKRSAVENSKDELKAPAPLNLSSKQRNDASQQSLAKSKTISTKPSIPAFKNPKFATLGPKERKQMMEIWRTGVAKERLSIRDGDNYGESEILAKEKVNGNNVETVKGKSRMDSTNSPIKEFVEVVLVDEANFSAAEAAALANEVEHSLTTSAKPTHSRHTSTASRHTSLHIPSITVQSPNEGFDSKNNPHPPESPIQQNPYQSLFNIGCCIMDRLKGTDLLALNRRLKRTFDILELSSLSNNLIENILADVELLRERFRWVEDLRKNDEIKTDEKEISANENYDNSSQKDPFAFSPENFLPLTHFMQDLLTEICKLRIMINDVQVEYFQKVEASRRKAEEEFDKSVLSGKDEEEIIERRERGRYSQSSDGGIGAYFSRVFGGVKEIQSPPTSARHHSRRLSVDFSHDRDVSVGSIDTFAEDSYFADRNLESYTNTSTKRMDNHETVGSMIRRNVVSFFGGGGGGNNTMLGKKNAAEEKVGKLVGGANGKKKFGTPNGHSVSTESYRHQRLASNENVLISASGNRCNNDNERSLLADISTTSPIRSPSSTTIQYIGSDGSPTTPQPISPPPPLTIITPKQTRLSTNNNNLENRLRQHLASTTPKNTVRIRDTINTTNREMETNEWNVVTILDKIFGGK
ncbi:hypothetical protein GLOIN_2v777671 [Rhizophagus clarus]|uniref:Uncharacterized protein n=1 Tax=Rhizophagus clarus TaxID=94130 RepID=A0A8H3QNV2_9GLOM|nr:hypothetical protein GLOIN_2v777671 [Rhizophagus clarus]